MDYKKWFKRFLVMTIGYLLIVITINLIVDPFEVFHTNIILGEKLRINNLRYNKIEYL